MKYFKPFGNTLILMIVAYNEMKNPNTEFQKIRMLHNTNPGNKTSPSYFVLDRGSGHSVVKHTCLQEVLKFKKTRSADLTDSPLD